MPEVGQPVRAFLMPRSPSSFQSQRPRGQAAEQVITHKKANPPPQTRAGTFNKGRGLAGLRLPLKQAGTAGRSSARPAAVNGLSIKLWGGLI